MKLYFENIYRGTREMLHQEIRKHLQKQEKMWLITANPETYMHAKKDKDFSKIVLQKKHYVVADGIGVILGCHRCKIENVTKMAGVELASFLLQVGNQLHKTIYLFGAKKEVIDQLISKIKQEYPNLDIVGYSHGYVENKNAVLEDIVKKEPDIVMIAFGIPEQEKMIEKCFKKVHKGIYIGVGGSFDVLSGSKKRAPLLFRKLNLEWLYRIVKEPKRLKRFYQNNIKFLFQIRK